MSEMETNETQVPIEPETTEAPADPATVSEEQVDTATEQADAATEMVRSGIERMRNEGIPIDLAPKDPEPEPTLAEKNAAKLAELEADPTLQARREARAQREEDLSLGTQVRELAQERARAQEISDAVDQLAADAWGDEETGEGAMVTYDDDGDVSWIDPQLTTRVAGLIDAGATPEQFAGLLEELGPEVLQPVLEGVARAYQHRDAQQQQHAAIEQAMQEQAPAIAASTRFVELRDLNPGVDAARAESIFSQMEYSSVEEGEAAAENAFRLVDAEMEAARATAAKEQWYIETLSKGDRDHYTNIAIPTLMAKAQGGDVESTLLLRQIMTPVPLDLDRAGLGPTDELGRRAGESIADAVRRPGGTAEFLKRALGHIDSEIARNQEREKAEAEATRAREKHNLETTGVRSGNPAEPGYQRRS